MRRRSRSKSSRLQRAGLSADHTEQWRRWVNPYKPIEIVSRDELEHIHTASLKVLCNTGIRVLSDEAQRYYEIGHHKINDGVVYFDTDALMEQVGNAPPIVQLNSRNDARRVVLGGNHVGIATTGGSPNFSNLKVGRRPGTLEALEAFFRVAQTFDVIHLVGPMVEPQDIAVDERHLHMTRSVVTLTDKVPFVYFRGRESVSEAFEIIRLANGFSMDEFTNTPCCYCVANTNSPLQLDDLMCAGIIDAAKAGQLTIITPFTLAGAMAPITLAGALVQQNAEALAGIALAQIVRPGAPVSYGSFTSNVDMRSGSPAFGTPEFTKAAFVSGQLARRYKIPLRSSGVTASNAPDAQAAYETQMSIWGTMMGGANVLLHGAGWLEGGLTASAEKFIIDVEMLQMFAELFKPLEVTDDTVAVSAIEDVGHGGHFFETQHTLDRYSSAFYSPLLSDWSNFENWRDNGGRDATVRASKLFDETIERYEKPDIDSANLEAIDAFIAKRNR